MKAGKPIIATLFLLSFVSAPMLFAQEYDDLYFNKSDRKAKKEAKKDPLAFQQKVEESQVPMSTEEYSSKNINPEYLARYDAKTAEADEVTAETTEYSEDDYYVETEERIDDNQAELISNYNQNTNYTNQFRPDYYRYPNSYYRPTAFRPIGFSPGWNVGMGYNFGSFYGHPYSGFNVSMSWGTGGYFGYDPFWDYGFGGWYDPWMSWNRPFYNPWRWNAGFGFYDYYAFAPYNRFYAPRYVTVVERPNYTYGRRDGRNTSTASSREYVSRSRTNQTSRVSNTRSNSRVANDYSRTQNEYYRHSNTRSVDSRTARDRSAYDIRSSSDRRSYENRINSASNNSRTSSPVYNNRPTRTREYSNTNNTYRRSEPTNYNRSRSNSNNSYSTPSRSNTNNSYTPSRSRSDSNSSYTPSRSRSSSSSSFSTPSRSSGSSSGSRSSSPSRSR